MNASFRFIFIFSISLLLFACPDNPNPNPGSDPTQTGQTQPGETQPADNPVTEPQPAAAKFSGFDLNFQQGDFWEFAWDAKESSFAMGSGSSSSSHSGRFAIILGNPATIDGIAAFEVLIAGKNRYSKSSFDVVFANRWKYLAAHDHKIYASEDGVSMKVLFDAITGTWPGSGLFMSFSSSTLVEATAGTISNNYLSAPALKVERSFSQSKCEFFPGIGTICGGDTNQNLNQREFYQPLVGPVGLFYSNSFESCGGGFCSGGSSTRNIGLVASSFTGDVYLNDMEIEPNDSAATAQPLVKGQMLDAVIKRTDPGSVHPQVEVSDLNGEQLIADWYVIDHQPPVFGFAAIDLSFTGIGDLDVYVFDANLNRVAAGLADNSIDKTESVSLASLPAGKYYVGVQAFLADKVLDYTLKLSNKSGLVSVSTP